jgi:hexokinase
VVQLLQNSLDARAIPMKAVALCNDTVGTLIARYFRDEHTEMGVILGTGANACYWEASKNVSKDSTVSKHGDLPTIINMEFGNFDSHYTHTLRPTEYDDVIDKASPNPGEQRFEKMISGMYLGEIARRCLCALSANNIIAAAVAEKIAKPYAFEAQDLALIASDRLPGMNFTHSHLKQRFGVDLHDKSDLWVIRSVCVLVRNRAAQLAGMAIAATLLKAEKTGNATIAIDGSVYEKTPSFKAILQTTIRTILGQESDVRLVLQSEGSGHGAGFIAALTTLNR